MDNDQIKPSGLPQFIVIAETIQGWIASGRYRAGDAIATVNDLAEQFDVGRGTIQEALKELSNRGIIVTSRGKRSTVRKTPQLRPVFSSMRLGELLFVEKVGEPEGELISANEVTPDEEMTNSFDFGADDILTEYKTLAYLNGRPNAFVISYFTQHNALQTNELTLNGVNEKLREVTEAAEESERRMSALPSDFEIATHLRIPVGTPVLRYRLILWHHRRQLDLYLDAYLRTDDCEYRLDA